MSYKLREQVKLQELPNTAQQIQLFKQPNNSFFLMSELNSQLNWQAPSNPNIVKNQLIEDDSFYDCNNTMQKQNDCGQPIPTNNESAFFDCNETYNIKDIDLKVNLPKDYKAKRDDSDDEIHESQFLDA